MHSESKSRNSKRGIINNQKVKNDAGLKSKSPAISNPRIDEFGPTLKERQAAIELAINKSVYLRTANFLIKNNAFAVMRFSFDLNLFFFIQLI